MSNEEELELILDEYSGFVRKIAASAIRPKRVVDYEDLYQVGEMAVLRAIKEYDPSCGRHLKSFVCSIVRQAIYNEAARFLGVFTVDHKVTELGAKINRLTIAGNTDEKIAEKLGKTTGRIKEVRLAYSRRQIVGLKDLAVNIDEEFTVEEFLAMIPTTEQECAILYNRILGGDSASEMATKLDLPIKKVYLLESNLKAKIKQAIKNIV